MNWLLSKCSNNLKSIRISSPPSIKKPLIGINIFPLSLVGVSNKYSLNCEPLIPKPTSNSNLNVIFCFSLKIICSPFLTKLILFYYIFK